MFQKKGFERSLYKGVKTGFTRTLLYGTPLGDMYNTTAEHSRVNTTMYIERL